MEYRSLFTVFLMDCEYRQLARDTMNNYRQTLKHFEEWAETGEEDIRQFFLYLRKRGVHPNTELGHYNRLRRCFRFLLSRSLLTQNPLDDVTPIREKKTAIHPFTSEEIEALLRSCGSNEKYRNIMLFLLDTGVRVGELCAVKCGDINLRERSCKINFGKGNKERIVQFGARVGREISGRVILSEKKYPLFPSYRDDKPLLRGSVADQITIIGNRAGVTGTRCSPHTFRHTFAIMFLRNGGNVFALQRLLGHSELKMTMQYVYIVQTDIAQQHREYSPVDNLRKR